MFMGRSWDDKVERTEACLCFREAGNQPEYGALKKKNVCTPGVNSGSILIP